MNILGVQIVTCLFAVFMIYVSFLDRKRKDIKDFDFYFWVALWLLFIFLSLFPNFLQNITNLLYFARVMDLLMVIAFMILTFLGYQNYVSNKKMEKKIEKLVRNRAIKRTLRKR